MIAIIVAIFSRGDEDSNAIRDPQKQVQALEQKIDDPGERTAVDESE